MLPLHLPAELGRRIDEQAVRAYPNECCGILIGRDLDPGGAAPRRLIERVVPVENVFEASQRFHRFAIDPRQLMVTERDSAAAGQSVVGFYHSHPDHPARPSDFDRERAWPFYSYLIVSIINGQAVDMTSWVLDDQTSTFHRQEIVQA